MSNKKLYKYIIENLDPEEECFTKETLIDEPHPTVPHPLGAEDAFWLATNAPADEKGANLVFRLLKEYRQYPDHLHKERLYKELSDRPVIAISEVLCDKLQELEITEDLVALARSFFYNAEHRGPLKFAYMLLGLYGAEAIKKEDAELWEDMVSVAQCEEFTHFFLFSCNLTNYKPLKEIWRLIGCTKGWGRVFAIEAVACNDEAQELWLIEHGMEITVDYPPVALRILEVANLTKHLEEESISYRTFKGAADILNAFLVLLNQQSKGIIEESLNTALIKPVALLNNFIRHAKIYADKPENILKVLNLSYGLRNLLTNDNLCIISNNELELLIAKCDSITYARNWEAYIKEHLILKDGINYELCDFACELDMDIWRELFDFLCEHPHEYQAMPYLFSYNDKNYQQMMLHFVEHNLSLYSLEETALLVPLRYLAHHPGEGERIIAAALTSPYDWPRGIACSVLNDWGPEYISEPVRETLKAALRLSNNAVVTARIEALLQGKKFNIDEIIE